MLLQRVQSSARHASERDHDTDLRFSALVSFVLYIDAHNNFRIFCARLRPFALNNLRLFDLRKQSLHEYPSGFLCGVNVGGFADAVPPAEQPTASQDHTRQGPTLWWTTGSEVNTFNGPRTQDGLHERRGLATFLPAPSRRALPLPPCAGAHRTLPLGH
jgi:hypothetical protein